jgi:hypothetical protein
MSAGFFKLGGDRPDRAQDPRSATRAAEDEANALLIASEESDRDAARLLKLARFLSPDCWRTRKNFLEMIERERNGPRANDPHTPHVIAGLERCAIGTVSYSIAKARGAIAIIKAWDQ